MNPLCASFFMLLAASLACFPITAWGKETVSTSQGTRVFELQVAEYVRKFPYQATYDYTIKFTGGNPKNLNIWLPKGEPRLARAGEDIVPHTNNDTYNKGAALFLASGPVVIESNAPTTERFNSFQFVDDRNANYRNIVFPAGKYTLYYGEGPASIEGQPIESPSAFTVVLARVEVRDKLNPDDVAAAKSIYNGMRIKGAPPAELPRIDLLGEYSDSVAAEANRRMDEVIANIPFTQTVVGPGMKPGRDVPFLYHAAGTKAGWGAPDPSHSAYELVLFDENGDRLSGRTGPYKVTTGEPPVNAFWSVTVYDSDTGGHLHPNPSDRYHFNGTTANRDLDGRITFVFRRSCANSQGNCLEVPYGRFDVVVRYYLPHEEIISGTWTFPKITPALD